jgi:hypothetical protein
MELYQTQTRNLSSMKSQSYMKYDFFQNLIFQRTLLQSISIAMTIQSYITGQYTDFDIGKWLFLMIKGEF